MRMIGESNPKRWTPFLSITSRLSFTVQNLDHRVCAGHKPAHTLRSELCTVKDKREVIDRNGVIYSIKCKDCKAEYIGETRKELRKRITEHKNAERRWGSRAGHNCN